jgi:hypothetical protein
MKKPVKGEVYRLRNLDKVELNGKRCKVAEVSKDTALVMCKVDGKLKNYYVEFESLGPDVDEPVVPEVAEIEVGRFYRLQNCRADMDNVLVQTLEMLDGGKWRVQDKEGNRYKVAEDKLVETDRTSFKTFKKTETAADDLIEVDDDSDVFDDTDVEPEEDDDVSADADDDAEPELSTIDLLAMGHTEFILVNCSDPSLNGLPVSFVEFVEGDDTRVRVTTQEDEPRKFKVAIERLEAVLDDSMDDGDDDDAASAYEDDAEQHETLSSSDAKIADAAGASLQRDLNAAVNSQFVKLWEFIEAVSGIDKSTLTMLCEAWRQGDVVLRDSETPAEVPPPTEAQLFATIAAQLGVDPSLYGRSFVAPFGAGPRELKVVAISATAPKQPIKVVDVDGKILWVAVEYVLQHLTAPTPVAASPTTTVA